MDKITQVLILLVLLNLNSWSWASQDSLNFEQEKSFNEIVLKEIELSRFNLLFNYENIYIRLYYYFQPKSFVY